jgi:Ca2+-binding RTX toxin-like protein
MSTATYFFKYSYGSSVLSSGLRTGTLADNDLTRGDDAREAVLPTAGPAIFDGIDTLTFDSQGQATFIKTPGEILASVTFADGTTLADVNALMDAVYVSYGGSNQYFLLDNAALAAVGKTMADVVDVTRIADTDHSLNWSDFGFSGTPGGTLPPPPPPPPPPVLNRIEGTGARDKLRGTALDDLIIGNGGNDTLAGRGGEDTFVFGRETGNGVREVDVITDYDAYADTILLTNGATIAQTIERGADIIIVLSGADGDRIVLKNQPDSGPLYQVQFDADFFG